MSKTSLASKNENANGEQMRESLDEGGINGIVLIHHYQVWRGSEDLGLLPLPLQRGKGELASMCCGTTFSSCCSPCVQASTAAAKSGRDGGSNCQGLAWVTTTSIATLAAKSLSGYSWLFEANIRSSYLASPNLILVS